MVYIFFAYLIIITIVTFVTFGVDKFRAVRNRFSRHRIPESRLLILAMAGGSIGGILGMLCWRHKTKHPNFYVGLPAILIAQLVIIAWIVLE